MNRTFSLVTGGTGGPHGIAPDPGDVDLPIRADDLAGQRHAVSLAVPTAGDGPGGTERHPRMEGLGRIAEACPCSRRSFAKLRGHAADAVVFDYIYGIETDEAPRPASAEERRALDATRRMPVSRALRFRRSVLAHLVDEAALHTRRPKVLSIMGGHLREIGLSGAAADDRLGEWMAFDWDLDNLAVVRRDYESLGAKTRAGTVQQFLDGRVALTGFDLTYAAGLPDLLDDVAAARLITRMVDVTRPGGQVVLSGFLPGFPDLGYMGSNMGWHPVCRSRDEVRSLFGPARSRVGDLRLFSDPDDIVAIARCTVL